MKNLLKICCLLMCIAVYNADAQQVVKVDTINGTRLQISMDSKVQNALEDMEDNCSRNTRNSGTASTGTTKPARVLVPSRELTNAEICRKNPRILGYKIQIAVVKSNTEANEVKSAFRRRFPNMKVETDASLRPNYKILAGSYFTKQSASGDLARIRQSFNTAVAVQYRVFCVEAK
ncbi:SPOR domain-containing protein [Marnyiella aurantia]|uniref:SPOR domain-containing protein n=1 Tax=Marnyiella aurantia TaxID=2758037 RepID=A0A7D7QXJ1_9FLAO|nr:SPOR domain-containing protein [Marnyiella aurantia]MBA5247013.1 SPOR domain-containing protein [Marnyiella aurantia]QMS97651.1 SPOR domain-containing protein [Marnyiella aurantia]